MADPRLRVVRVAGQPVSQATDPQPVFYYDLGSPTSYIVAEQIMSALSVVPEWEPVAAADLGLDLGEGDRSGLERAAQLAGLQPFRWPEPWPAQTREAMLAATYAKHIGRAVAFSLAAFRQAFAGGRNLGDRDTILIAAAACEIHPTAVLKGVGLRSTGRSLQAAGDRAAQAGVSRLPAIEVGGQVFEGLDAIAGVSAAGAL